MYLKYALSYIVQDADRQEIELPSRYYSCHRIVNHGRDRRPLCIILNAGDITYIYIDSSMKAAL